MNKQMTRQLTKQYYRFIPVLLSLWVAACTSPVARLSPDQVVIQGMQKLYEQPNYTATTRIKLNDINLSFVSKKGTKEEKEEKEEKEDKQEQPEKDSIEASTYTPEKALALANDFMQEGSTKKPEDAQLIKLMSLWLKEMAINQHVELRTTVDIPSRRVELQPSVRYVSKYLQSNWSVPFLLDLKQGHIYTEADALTPFLAGYDQKNTVVMFDVKQWLDRVDLKKLYEYKKQSEKGLYEQMPATTFKRVDLSPAMAQYGAAYQIRMQHALTDYVDLALKNQEKNKQLLIDAFKPLAANTQSSDVNKVATDALDSYAKQNYSHVVADVLQKLVKPSSTLVEDVGVDKQGRPVFIQRQYHLAFADDFPITGFMQLGEQTTYSNYGSAKIAFNAQALPVVAGDAALKNSMVGLLMQSVKNKKGNEDTAAEPEEEAAAEDAAATAVDEARSITPKKVSKIKK